jgi:hypothetical protein
MSENKSYPLIVVFYLDRDMMSNPSIIQPFAESVNILIEQKEANMMAFFLPTDGEERIEIVNPIQVESTEMERINNIVNDLVLNFGMNSKEDDKSNELN